MHRYIHFLPKITELDNKTKFSLLFFRGEGVCWGTGKNKIYSFMGSV